ncbi:MAG TPA: RimK/LysX family protein [Candidatus Krumholzibacteria bacterium]|nr:RimK/LysX family protein [Candidatus Krumholzibacteria bacterium]HRX51256.1 RimK/LysX family protein [Candidatus Krumholzibacteria bacterium]
MPRKPKDPVVVGWREFVALPEWGIPRLKAKVDTGARTSAIHVGALEELPDGRVRFQVVVRETPNLRTTWVEATPVRRATIKPSSGVRQERLVFRTRMEIGPIARDVELSLVSRKGMLCRMLVGRRALPAHVLVSPVRKYLHSDAPGTRRKSGEAK